MHGTITVTLRPLKFAFLVHPQDRAGLHQAIELNTILWGGEFNPIIPTYQRLPPGWHGQSLSLLSARDVFAGYLDAYDPDYVVPLGRITEPPFPVGHRAVLSCDDVLGEFEKTGEPGYGIGIFDLLRHFVTEELRFKRRFPLPVVMPEPYRRHSLFLASTLGTLPGTALAALRDHWTDPLDASWQKCELHSYAQLYDQDVLFPRRLSSLYVGEVRHDSWRRQDCIFLMDATRVTDIIDFWNLRAMGWAVMPVPLQAYDSVEIQNLTRDFIEENFYSYRSNPWVYNDTTVLISQHVTEDEGNTFIEALEIPRAKDTSKSKVPLQRWYPRIWDSWARKHDGVETYHLESDTRSLDIPDDRRNIRLKTLDPKFMRRYGGGVQTRFANMVDMKFYGASDLVAEVMPEGERSLVRAIGGVDFRDWRFSRSGMTYLSSHKDWSIHLEVPESEAVFIEWFKQRGWEVALSPAGRIAKQTFLALGGTWGVRALTNEGIVELLQRMSNGKAMRRKAFIGEISRIANLDEFPVEPDHLLKKLTSHRIVRLGVEVQCPVCTQYSWYSLEDVAYSLQCLKCLEKFEIPSHSPDELAWSYRSFGPFSLPGYAQGSYAVLLTHYFFSRNLDGSTTAIMSFNAHCGDKAIEADLGLFFGQRLFGKSSTDLLFAECKSYGRFERRDVDRMTGLGAEFPGAILVFSTLRKELSTNEKRLIGQAANRGRRFSPSDPNHNPVLVLTGIELFADWRPPQCWKDAGGKFAEFADDRRGYGGILELCDCTQQLHLDMDPYYEWLDQRHERRRRRARGN